MIDNDLVLQILREFKKLNNVEDNHYDEMFKLYIKKSVQTILNLTNRIQLPEELFYVVIDMLLDFYNDKILKENIGSDKNMFISSISEEGRAVQFSNISEITLNSILSTDISNKLATRQKEINRYRLLYKVGDKK